MANFSFGDNLGSSQSTAGSQLEGNKIHEVTFNGATKEEFDNKKDPSQPYSVLRLKFSNDDGTFEHTVFEPRQEDFNRRMSELTDKKTGAPITIPNPSNVESMMLLFKHAIDAVVPEIGKKIDNKEINLAATSWDDLRDKMVQIFEKGKDAKTCIKVIKDKNGYARFPGFFASVGKDDDKPYIRNNFIGKKLGFTPYETTRIKNEEKAAPTQMSLDEPIIDSNTDGIDLDFDVDSL